MDETPLTFDMLCNKTVDTKGVKSVVVRSTGHEKTRFTVVLSCLADGTKLKPMVIFKRKRKPKNTFPPGVFVHYHENGWMDENGVKLWIDKIWKKRPGGANRPSLLVWDAFGSHITEATTSHLNRCDTKAAVIPGGLTSIFQPLDVSLHKPLKDHVRQEWNKWMLNGQKSYTVGGFMRAPSLELLCQFVVNAWDKDDILWANNEQEEDNQASSETDECEEGIDCEHDSIPGEHVSDVDESCQVTAT
uniref:DDE-1 domain-containing protein n=1 Tax=Trichuris muris TaxID=70415 RepID=A0A5S6QHM3_TRIMR